MITRNLKCYWMACSLGVGLAAANISLAQTTPPPGGRAATRPAVTIEPPADAVAVDLAPPLDKDGNFGCCAQRRGGRMCRRLW